MPPMSRAVPVATRMNDVRFKRMVRPGETIEMEVELTEQLAERLLSAGQGDLRRQDWPCSFEFTCAMTPVPQDS